MHNSNITAYNVERGEGEIAHGSRQPSNLQGSNYLLCKRAVFSSSLLPAKAQFEPQGD